jgi:hypothetical protein
MMMFIDFENQNHKKESPLFIYSQEVFYNKNKNQQTGLKRRGDDCGNGMVGDQKWMESLKNEKEKKANNKSFMEQHVSSSVSSFYINLPRSPSIF